MAATNETARRHTAGPGGEMVLGWLCPGPGCPVCPGTAPLPTGGTTASRVAASLPAPVWQPWPSVRPGVTVALRWGAVALLALALALVPTARASSEPAVPGPTTTTAPAPATCGSDSDCCAQHGPPGPLCGAPVPACPAGTAANWAGQCTALGTTAQPGPGNQCTEDMPCWCVAHGLPAGQCTTADPELPVPPPAAPALAPVLAQPASTG